MGLDPEATGRASYHPLDPAEGLYIYGYAQSRFSRVGALSDEARAQRGGDVGILASACTPTTRRLPIFRKDNGAAIRKVCAHFIALCRVDGPADA